MEHPYIENHPSVRHHSIPFQSFLQFDRILSLPMQMLICSVSIFHGINQNHYTHFQQPGGA